MSDRKPKFQIGDIVVISDTPTTKGRKYLEKLIFYTIANYKKSSDVHLYQINYFDDNWFAERNFYLYSKANNEWIPFEKCNNIEVGDHVRLDYNEYNSRTSEDINKMFDIHEYRVISDIDNDYILVEGDHYPMHPSFLLYKKPNNVSQNKPNNDKYIETVLNKLKEPEIKKDIFDVNLSKSKNSKPLVVYTPETDFCDSPQEHNNVNQIKSKLFKDVTENYIISDSTVIDFNYGENLQIHDCNASPEDEQIFNAMQKTLDAAKYSAFPFGSPDYLMNIKFGGSYNKN